MLESTTPLSGYSSTINSVEIREKSGLSIVSLAVPSGGSRKFQTAIKQAYGLSLPAAGRFTGGDQLALIWMTPEQYFLVSAQESLRPELEVVNKIGKTAYVTNQSDGNTIISVSGPRCLEALERICPVDLHPTSFGKGSAARTVMEHLGVTIMRMSASEYWLISASSSAGSFLHTIMVSAENI